MNGFLQNKIVEVVATNNVAYMLNSNNDFSVTGYKVMQNQNNTGLLPCAKLMYNGKVKLVYMVGNYKPLSFVVTRFGINELNAVIFNLIQRAMDIQGNGFFRAENLELDFDKIFVDMSDYTVHLIYFPVSSGNTGKISNFDSEFRVALINLFNSFPVFTAPQFQRLCSDLSNGSLPLNQVLKKLQDNINGNVYSSGQQRIGQDPSYAGVTPTPQQPAFNGQNQGFTPPQPAYNGQNQGFTPPQPAFNIQNPNQQQGFSNPNGFGSNPGYQQPVAQQSYVAPQPTMTIQSIGSPVQINLTVAEPEYLIGKNPSMVNGAVTHNPAISRVHCKISFMNGKYYLTDMGSANGTYLNQQRLEKQQTLELHSGDYIRLANSDFIVTY